MTSKSNQRLKNFLPILDWLPHYKRSDLKGDIPAGLTVGVMLIPQGMAYAMLAGLPPIHGLYAVTVPLILYVLFGTSRQLAVGPVAIVSLLTATGIETLSPSNPEQYLLYVLTLAFLVGLIQILMGLFKLGFVVNFLSHPVISGFTSAAAIVIGLSQIKHLLGLDLPNTAYFHEMVLSIFQNLGKIHWPTFGMGIMGILIIAYGKKIHSAFPSALMAVIVGVLLVWSFGLEDRGIGIMGDVPGGLPSLSYPLFDFSIWQGLLPIAVTISLIGFAESFAIAKTIQSKHKTYRLNANQELIGLGMANFGAAFFRGYPVTGGFSRTAVNHEAGAKTGLSSIISAGLIVLTLLFFTDLFYYLPNAILGAVILVAISGLIDTKGAFQLWKRDKADFSMLAATFMTTLILGVEIGIATGMVLSLLMVIYKASRPHMAQLARVPGTHIFRNIERFDNLELREDLLIVRADGPIYFANVEFIKDRMDKWIGEKKRALRVVLFNMESVTSLDSTGAHEMGEWISEWRSEGLEVFVTGAKGPVRDAFSRLGMTDYIGAERMFVDDHSAIKYLEQTRDMGETSSLINYAIQSKASPKKKP